MVIHPAHRMAPGLSGLAGLALLHLSQIDRFSYSALVDLHAFELQRRTLHISYSGYRRYRIFRAIVW